MEHFEFLVIGSGEAGKYLAWTMAQDGYRTALVERKMVGGSCPNVACLPSKNIIHSAKVASLLGRAEEFGLECAPHHADMGRVWKRKQEMVDGLRDMHLQRFKNSGTELVMGEARFSGNRKVIVTLPAGGSRTLTGDRMILSLGTRAAIPDIPGLAAAAPMTHVEALDLQRLPEHLLVLGGGYIGLEMAQALRRLGSRVTVIERGPQLAAREDTDIGSALLELFHDEGIDVLLGTKVLDVQGRSGEHVQVTVGGSEATSKVEGTDLLVAAGRTPNTQSIGLDAAGIEIDNRGYIVVNDRLETSAENVWAVGDCAGSPQFTHAAYDDFRTVRANLRGGHSSTRNRIVPYCVFTDPELVRVGLNEREAQKLGMDYRLLKLPMAAVLRTRTVSAPRGFMKMLIGAASDEILGFTAFGVEASELLAAVQTAVAGNLPYTVLRDAIFTHPTIAEGLVFLLDGSPEPVQHRNS